MPSELLLRLRGGSRQVAPPEDTEPTEMLHRFFGGLADDRNLQAAADSFGDVPQGHALLSDSIISGSRGTLLKHESIETRNVEQMCRRPAIGTVTDIR